MNEFIAMSAIWLNDGINHPEQPINITTGIVIAGRRHMNCYATISLLDTTGEWDKLLDTEKMVKGFITSHARFVSREEAAKIATEANQLINPKLREGTQFELISEDIFPYISGE